MACGEARQAMGNCCRRGDDYDSDDSDFDSSELMAANVLDDDELDPELLAQASLPEVFLEIDDDNSGLIEYPEFLRGFGIDDTPLVQKMFYIFDEDRSGSLDFYEFLKLIDKYRRMTYEEKLKWCFQVYDLDGSGYIEKVEFHAILSDMNFGVRNHGATRAMILKMGNHYAEKFGEPMEKVDVRQFVVLCKSYGTLIVYPALGLMERLMGMVLQNPDSHIGAMDCLRPGAASLYRARALAAEQEADFNDLD